MNDEQFYLLIKALKAIVYAILSLSNMYTNMSGKSLALINETFDKAQDTFYVEDARRVFNENKEHQEKMRKERENKNG